MTATELIASVQEIKSPSPAVTRLISLLSQPEADQDEILSAVRQDGVVSARLLALCNSASVGAADIGSVDQALLHLGHREVYRLVLSLGFGTALGTTLPGYGMDQSALWRHSLLTGLVTESVLAALPDVQVDASIAYTAGLVHDIGKVILNHTLDAGTQSAIRELVEKEDCALIEAEHRIIGADHAEVGACLLARWRLPEAIVEAVAHHHAPVLQPRPQISAIVQLADVLAHQAGAAPGWASYAVRSGEQTAEALGLTIEAMQQLIISAYDATGCVEEMAAAA